MRNVNQGQRGHPSTDDILAGFADAGCPDVVTFRSNGTILFDSRSPRKTVDTAAAAIASRSGHPRDILWIPLKEVRAVVEKHGGTSEPRRFEFTVHGAGPIDREDPEVAAEAERNRCEIVDTGARWVLVRNSIPGEGHATPTVERITGRRATSRGLPTMVRLVERFG